MLFFENNVNEFLSFYHNLKISIFSHFFFITPNAEIVISSEDSERGQMVKKRRTSRDHDYRSSKSKTTRKGRVGKFQIFKNI